MPRKKKQSKNLRKHLSNSSHDEPDVPQVPEPGLQNSVPPEPADDVDLDDPEMKDLYERFKDSQEFDKKLQYIMMRKNQGELLMATDKKRALINFKIAAELLVNFNVTIHTAVEVGQLEARLIEVYCLMMRLFNESKTFEDTLHIAQCAKMYAPHTARCHWEFLLLWADALFEMGKFKRAKKKYDAAYLMADDDSSVKRMIGEKIVYVQKIRDRLENSELQNEMPLEEPQKTDEFLNNIMRNEKLDFERACADIKKAFENNNMKDFEALANKKLGIEETKKVDYEEYFKITDEYKKKVKELNEKRNQEKLREDIGQAFETFGIKNFEVSLKDINKRLKDKLLTGDASNINSEKDKDKGMYDVKKFGKLCEDITKAFKKSRMEDSEVSANTALKDRNKQMENKKYMEDMEDVNNHNIDKDKHLKDKEYMEGASNLYYKITSEDLLKGLKKLEDSEVSANTALKDRNKQMENKKYMEDMEDVNNHNIDKSKHLKDKEYMKGANYLCYKLTSEDLTTALKKLKDSEVSANTALKDKNKQMENEKYMEDSEVSANTALKDKKKQMENKKYMEDSEVSANTALKDKKKQMENKKYMEDSEVSANTALKDKNKQMKNKKYMEDSEVSANTALKDKNKQMKNKKYMEDSEVSANTALKDKNKQMKNKKYMKDSEVSANTALKDKNKQMKNKKYMEDSEVSANTALKDKNKQMKNKKYMKDSEVSANTALKDKSKQMKNKKYMEDSEVSANTALKDKNKQMKNKKYMKDNEVSANTALKDKNKQMKNKKYMKDSEVSANTALKDKNKQMKNKKYMKDSEVSANTALKDKNKQMKNKKYMKDSEVSANTALKDKNKQKKNKKYMEDMEDVIKHNIDIGKHLKLGNKHIELGNKQTKNEVDYDKDDKYMEAVSIEEDKQLKDKEYVSDVSNSYNEKVKDKQLKDKKYVEDFSNHNIVKNKTKLCKDNESIAGPSNSKILKNNGKQFKDYEKDYEVLKETMELKIKKCQEEEGAEFQKYVKEEFIKHLHKLVSNKLSEYMEDFDKKNKIANRNLSFQQRRKLEIARKEFYVMKKGMLECERKKILVNHQKMDDNVETKMRKDKESKKKKKKKKSR